VQIRNIHVIRVPVFAIVSHWFYSFFLNNSEKKFSSILCQYLFHKGKEVWYENYKPRRARKGTPMQSFFLTGQAKKNINPINTVFTNLEKVYKVFLPATPFSMVDQSDYFLIDSHFRQKPDTVRGNDNLFMFSL